MNMIQKNPICISVVAERGRPTCDQVAICEGVEARGAEQVLCSRRNTGHAVRRRRAASTKQSLGLILAFFVLLQSARPSLAQDGRAIAVRDEGKQPVTFCAIVTVNSFRVQL